MIFSNKIREFVFKLFAVVCVVIAAYHVAGMFVKVNESPVWRHGLFVGINLFCAYACLSRPRYFIFLYSVLMVQQYYSHSGSLVNMWQEQGVIDWISLFVLVLFPVGFILLWDDRNRLAQ